MSLLGSFSVLEQKPKAQHTILGIYPYTNNLAFGTPNIPKKKKNPHEMCQMPNNFGIRYSTILLTIYYYFIKLLSLSLSLSLILLTISYFSFTIFLSPSSSPHAIDLLRHAANLILFPSHKPLISPSSLAMPLILPSSSNLAANCPPPQSCHPSHLLPIVFRLLLWVVVADFGYGLILVVVVTAMCGG